MSTRLAEVTRGGIVESVHDGVVVAVDSSGAVVGAAGNPETVAFFRSSAKPFQAIPVIESGAADRFGFTPSDLALCCASHHGEIGQQEQVQAMLGRLGLDPSALQCGISGPADSEARAKVIRGERQPTPLSCDCSGKHTGMLASCLALGFPIENYLELEHPLQQRIRALVAEVCRVPVESLVMGTDGCSVPTFGTSIRAFATAFTALADPHRVPDGAGKEHAEALDRLRAAMIAFPENVSGHHALVAEVMRIGNGAFVCKSGAEGLFCLGVPERGIGLAIRIADGSFRAHGVVLASALEQLGLATPEQAEAIRTVESPQLRNHNGRLVGEIRAAFRMN